MYKEINIDVHGEQQKHIVRDNGNGGFTSFPADQSNSLFQEYQRWLAEGNQPLPADEVAPAE